MDVLLIFMESDIEVRLEVELVCSPPKPVLGDMPLPGRSHLLKVS